MEAMLLWYPCLLGKNLIVYHQVLIIKFISIFTESCILAKRSKITSKTKKANLEMNLFTIDR